MRVAPLGIYHGIQKPRDYLQLVQDAIADARLTHANQAVEHANALYVLLLAESIAHGAVTPPRHLLEQARNRLPRLLGEPLHAGVLERAEQAQAGQKP